MFLLPEQYKGMNKYSAGSRMDTAIGFGASHKETEDSASSRQFFSGHIVLLNLQNICVTILPCTPQKPSQNDNTAKADDLKRRACDIARDSHGIEDKIRAMVSSYMAPKDDEDSELAIG